jgi:hypothetical protein
MKYAWTIVLLTALICGCARTSTMSLVAGDPAATGRTLGRTVVLTWFAFEEKDKAGQDKAARLRTLVLARLRALPGITPVDDGPFVAALGARSWRNASDMELAAAARAVGVDSVAVVEVASLGGKLHISLPPSWTVETSFAYRARLLDVPSGSLILSAMRGRDVDQPFAMRGREALYQDFEADLAELTQSLAQKTDK